MSLIIVLKQLDSAGRKIVMERHVPFTVNYKRQLPELSHDDIEYIQADGDELDVILDCFEGIPYLYRLNKEPQRTFCPVQRWYGDWAKQIYFNL